MFNKKYANENIDKRIHVDINYLHSLESHADSLNLLPRQAAKSILSGRHNSKLRGRGLNFEELRDYLPGDDSRTIDWKVTARTGKPHVRVYTEERDRPCLLIVDQRMSMFFGSQLNMKSVTAAEAAALAAFRILHQGDRIGGIVFTDDQVLEFKPMQSRKSLDGFLSALAAANMALDANTPPVKPMSINQPLEMASRIARSGHIIGIFSDFDQIDEHTETLIGGMAAHNDVLMFLVSDPLAHNIGNNLQMVFTDGQLQAIMDTAEGEIREQLADFLATRFSKIHALSNNAGVPVLPLSTGQETLPQIRQLMGEQV